MNFFGNFFFSLLWLFSFYTHAMEVDDVGEKENENKVKSEKVRKSRMTRTDSKSDLPSARGKKSSKTEPSKRLSDKKREKTKIIIEDSTSALPKLKLEEPRSPKKNKLTSDDSHCALTLSAPEEKKVSKRTKVAIKNSSGEVAKKSIDKPEIIFEESQDSPIASPINHPKSKVNLDDTEAYSDDDEFGFGPNNPCVKPDINPEEDYSTYGEHDWINTFRSPFEHPSRSSDSNDNRSSGSGVVRISEKVEHFNPKSLELCDQILDSTIFNEPKKQVIQTDNIDLTQSCDDFEHPWAKCTRALDELKECILIGTDKELQSFFEKTPVETLQYPEFYDLFIDSIKQGSDLCDIFLQYEKKLCPQPEIPRILAKHHQGEIAEIFSQEKYEKLRDLLPYSYALYMSDVEYLKMLKVSIPWVRISFVKLLSKTFPYGPLSCAAIKELKEIFCKNEFSPTEIEKIWMRVAEEKRKNLLPTPAEELDKEKFCRWISQDALKLAQEIDVWTVCVRRAVNLSEFMSDCCGPASKAGIFMGQLSTLIKLIQKYIDAQDEKQNEVIKKCIDAAELLIVKGNYEAAVIFSIIPVMNVEKVNKSLIHKVNTLKEFSTSRTNLTDLSKVAEKTFPMQKITVYMNNRKEKIDNDAEELAKLYKTLFMALRNKPDVVGHRLNNEYLNMLLTLPLDVEDLSFTKEEINSQKISSRKRSQSFLSPRQNSGAIYNRAQQQPSTSSDGGEDKKNPPEGSPIKKTTGATVANSASTEDSKSFEAASPRTARRVASSNKFSRSRSRSLNGYTSSQLTKRDSVQLDNSY